MAKSTIPKRRASHQLLFFFIFTQSYLTQAVGASRGKLYNSFMKPNQKIISCLVGLGNPGVAYVASRHSAGRAVLLSWAESPGLATTVSPWRPDLKAKALSAEGLIGRPAGQPARRKFRLILPENFMNNSGSSLKPFLKSKAEIASLLVIHDDLDLPLGALKLSFGRGSGGHRGVESIIKALKTKDFARLRIGIAPQTPSGKLKRSPIRHRGPDFVIANFKPAEAVIFKKAIKQAKSIIDLALSEGLETAMNFGNRKVEMTKTKKKGK